MQADNTPDQQSVKPMEKFKGKGLLKMLASPRGRGNSTSQPFGSTPAKDIADAEPALRDSEAKPTPTNSKIWGKLWGSRRSSESPRCSPGSPKVLGAAGAADDTMPLRVTPIRTAPADSSRDDVSDVADNDSHYSTPMLGGAASPGTSPLGAGMDQTLVLTPGVLTYDDGATPLGQKQGMSDVLTPGFLASLGEAPGSPTSEYEDADADMMTVALVPAEKLASLPGAYHMPQQALFMQPESPAVAAPPAAAAAAAPAVAVPASAPSAVEGREELVSSTPTGSAMPCARSAQEVDVGEVALAMDTAASPLASPEPDTSATIAQAEAQAAPVSTPSSRAATPVEAAAAAAVAARGPSPAPAAPPPAAAGEEDGVAPMDMDEPITAVAAASSSASPRPLSPADAAAAVPSRSSSSPAPALSPAAEAGAAASGRSTPLQAPSPVPATAVAMLPGQANRSAAASPHSSLVSPAGGAASHSLDDISSSGTPSPAIEPSFPPLGEEAPAAVAQEGEPAAAQEVEGVLASPSTAAAAAAAEEERVLSPVSVQAAADAAGAGAADAAAPAAEEQAGVNLLEQSSEQSTQEPAVAAVVVEEAAEAASRTVSVTPAVVVQEGDNSVDAAAAASEEEAGAAAVQPAVEASGGVAPTELAASPTAAAAAAVCEDSDEEPALPHEMLPDVLSCNSSSLVMQASGPAAESSGEGGVSAGHPATPEDSLMDADDDLLSCPTPSEEPVLPPAGVAPHLARRASPAASKFTPVRESLPLFATNAMRDSQMVSSSLLDEDERLLDEGRTEEPGELDGSAAAAPGGSSSAAGGGSSKGAAGGGKAWGRMGRSLGGGAQRVTSAGGMNSGAFISRLAPVEEAGASEVDGTSPQRAAAARMSPVQEEAGGTPLQPRALEEGLHEGRSPGELSFGGSPLGAATAAAATPAAPAAAGGAMATPSTADGFTLRPPRGSSPQAGGATFTPTMALHTGLAGAGDTTQALMAGIDAPAALGGALTPSLLDTAAASPSLVYGGGRFLATPLRSQLEALPLDAARHAPLLDSSPLSLGGEDTTISLEAQRALYHLEGGGEPSPKVSPKGGMGMAASAVYQEMLIKKLTEAEEALKHLQFDNEKLQEQLCTLEFQKDEMSNQDEFEREAREFAEAQLAAAQAELAAMRSARAADQAEIGRLQEVVAKVQGEAAAALQAKDGEQLAVQEQLVQARADFAAASDRLQETEVKLMNAQADAKAVAAQLEAAQKEQAQLMACVEQREKDVADLLREQQQQKVQLEKAMEQLIAAQTQKEHAVRKANEDRARLQRTEGALQQALGAHEVARNELAALQQKYALQAKSLEDARKQVADQQLEIAEVMGMCDTLLSEREKLKGGQ